GADRSFRFHRLVLQPARAPAARAAETGRVRGQRHRRRRRRQRRARLRPRACRALGELRAVIREARPGARFGRHLFPAAAGGHRARDGPRAPRRKALRRGRRALGPHLESARRREAPCRGERACARARRRADQGLRPAEKGDLRLGGQLARCAARARARPAARGGILRGLPRGRFGLHGKARAALPGQVNAFALEPIEKAPPAQLKALQLERLRWTLQHAYENVPHYRRKFDAAGVKPQDCRSLADLARFPFTTKSDLRETYPFGMFAVPMDRVVRIHASSGTTGKPTVVGYSAKDIDTWAGVMARSIRAAGGRPGDKVHVAYGYGLFTGGLGAHYGAEKLGCTVIPASGGMTARQVQLINDFRPDVIMVTPSYLLTLIDPIEENVLDDGETGELLFTSLTKQAMPVIRYRTRDLTHLMPGTARPMMRRMAKVTGRSDDMIILRGVNLFPTQIEEIVLRTDGLAAHFQLVLSKKDRMDMLTVQVEARAETSAQRRLDAARELAGAVKDGV